MKAKSNRKPKTIQYTIRSIPVEIDQLLRQRATQQNKSLNEVILDVLSEGLKLADQPKVYRDLDFAIGTWVEDPAFDEVIADHDKIDEEMWR